jgi:hypothetical protein
MFTDYLSWSRSCRNAVPMGYVDRGVGKRLLSFVFLCLAAASLSHGLRAEEPRSGLMPLGEVKKGMTGYGLTVFDGRDVERFDVEILGVL